MKAVKEFELQGAVIKEISLPSTEYAINTYYIIAVSRGFIKSCKIRRCKVWLQNI